MKTQIFLLVSACCVLIYGKNIDRKELKRERLLQAMERVRNQDSRRLFGSANTPPSSPTQGPNPGARDRLLEEIQGLLGEIANSLNGFKETGSSSVPDLQLNGKISEVENKLQGLIDNLDMVLNKTNMKNKLWEMYEEIVWISGDVFEKPFKNYLLTHYPTPERQRVYSENDDMGQTPLDKLQMVLQDLDYIKELIASIGDNGRTSERLLGALLAGLRFAREHPVTTGTTSGNTEGTTQQATSSTTDDWDSSDFSWWNMMDSAESSESLSSDSNAMPSSTSNPTPSPTPPSVKRSYLRKRLLELIAKVYFNR